MVRKKMSEVAWSHIHIDHINRTRRTARSTHNTHKSLPHLGAARRRVGETPRGGDGRVEDHVGGLGGDLGPEGVQARLLYPKPELPVPVPMDVAVRSRLPLWWGVKVVWRRKA